MNFKKKALALLLIAVMICTNAMPAFASSTTIGGSVNNPPDYSDSLLLNLTATPTSYYGATDGKISGVTDQMEYSKDGTTWISVPKGATEITGLPAGDYPVRVKETATELPSKSVIVTVENGPQDVTAPTGEITIKNSSWREFVNTITFNQVYKETQTVTITASDDLSGVKSIQYCILHEAQALAQIQAYSEDKWTTYTEAFTISALGQYVIVAKLSDHVGNVSYITSDGLVFTADVTLPLAAKDLTYNGSEQTYGIIVPAHTTVTGNKGTNAGTYTCTLTLDEYYTWADGTKEPKTYTWAIKKRAGASAPSGITYDAVSKRIIGLDDGSSYEVNLPGQTEETISVTGVSVIYPTEDRTAYGKLKPGTYYIRLAGDENNEPSGWAVVVVGKESPKLTTLSPKDITSNSATVTASLSMLDGVTQVTLRYQKTGENNWTTVTVDTSTTLSKKLTSLSENTEYSYQFVVTTEDGTITGDIKSFRTEKKNIPQGKVTAEVTNESGETRRAQITIESGTTVLASRSVEVASGKTVATEAFSKLADGIYNLVLRTEDGDFTETKTITITNGSAEHVAFTIIKGELSTTVEMVGEDTPAIAVGGLGEIVSEDEKESIQDGSVNIHVYLTVEKQDISETATEEVKNDMQKAEQLIDTTSYEIADVLDMGLFKTTETLDANGNTTSQATENIGSENTQVLELVGPNTYGAIYGLQVVRIHEGQAQAFTRIEGRAAAPFTDGTFAVDENYVYIYSSDFSNFAIITPIGGSDEDSFRIYQEKKKSEADSLEQAGDSQAVLELIAQAKTEIDGTSYNDAKTLSENKAVIDKIVDDLKTTIEAQRAADKLSADKVAFEQYKNHRKDYADTLVQTGDSQDCKDLIANAKKAIDNLSYDEGKTLEENKAAVDAIISKLITDLAAQRSADQAASDREAFELYKTAGKTSADALAQSGDSDACKKFITDAKGVMDALTYDDGKTLDQNRARVDAILNQLKTDLSTQRAVDKLASEKAAFEQHKKDQQTAADNLGKDDDSDICKQLIADAKAEMEALTYDESKILDENKAKVDAILDNLSKQLTAQRASEKEEADLEAKKAAFESYKTKQKTVADNMLTSSDSDACKKLVLDAKAAIDALTYDEGKTLDGNKARVDAIMNKLVTDIAAQRTAEKNDDPETVITPTNPRTGDDTNLTLWIVLMLSALAGLFGCIIIAKRKKENS